MLRFHDIHGNNIQLEEDEHKAVRNSQDSFCDGVTFRLAKFFTLAGLDFGGHLLSSHWDRGTIK